MSQSGKEASYFTQNLKTGPPEVMSELVCRCEQEIRRVGKGLRGFGTKACVGDYGR